MLGTGTVGSQNSGSSQHGCWEIDAGAGNQLGTGTGVENPVVPSTGAGNQMGTFEQVPSTTETFT